MATYTITVAPKEGSGGTSQFYYDTVTNAFYLSPELGETTRWIEPPALECHRLLGLFPNDDAADPGIYCVAEDGLIRHGWTPTESMTVYARWDRCSYKMTIDKAGGTGGTDALYYYFGPNDSPGWYLDDQGMTSLGIRIDPPTRDGYSDDGVFSKEDEDVQYILPGGLPTTTLYALVLTDDEEAVTKWKANRYTLTFDYVDGHGGTASIETTFGEQIGTLPTATSRHGDFEGWYLNGNRIYPNTIWNIPDDGCAVASYNYYFGRLTDFFGLETANGPLMLVASNPGSTRTVIETSHTGALAIQSGDSSVGAFKTFGLLMNPVCTYRIRKEGRVTINLGSAWSGSGTKSGYMLVNAEYATAADGEPVLVVRGAANEGANAVNRILNASRWSVNLDVNPDHIAQDPMNAVNGGGELTECKTLITCDPVVPMENGMPCASDIVHGKVIVTATTNAYGGENAPTARSPFIETNGVPPDETDVDFTTYALTAEKSL